MKRWSYLIVLGGTVAQYQVLQLSEPGRRHALAVSVCTLLIALIVGHWARTSMVHSRVMKTFAFVVAPMVSATFIWYLLEQIGRPVGANWIQNDGLTGIVFYLLLAGGWIVGLAALVGFVVFNDRNQYMKKC